MNPIQPLTNPGLSSLQEITQKMQAPASYASKLFSEWTVVTMIFTLLFGIAFAMCFGLLSEKIFNDGGISGIVLTMMIALLVIFIAPNFYPNHSEKEEKELIEKAQTIVLDEYPLMTLRNTLELGYDKDQSWMLITKDTTYDRMGLFRSKPTKGTYYEVGEQNGKIVLGNITDPTQASLYHAQQELNQLNIHLLPKNIQSDSDYIPITIQAVDKQQQVVAIKLEYKGDALEMNIQPINKTVVIQNK